MKSESPLQLADRATRLANRLTEAADSVLSGDSGFYTENEDGNAPRDQIAVALEAHKAAAILHQQVGNADKAEKHEATVQELDKALKTWDRDYEAHLQSK